MPKLTDKTELATAPDSGDLVHIVDVSDTTSDPSGTSKKIEYSNLLSVVDDLTSTDADKPLSANQGKTLNDDKQDKSAKASSAEVTTGTDDDKFITPLGLKDSDYGTLNKTDLFGVGSSLHANIATVDMGGSSPSTSKIYYYVLPDGRIIVSGAFSVTSDIVASGGTGIILLDGASLLNGAATMDSPASLIEADAGGTGTLLPCWFDRSSNNINIGNGVTLSTGVEFMVHAVIFAY